MPSPSPTALEFTLDCLDGAMRAEPSGTGVALTIERDDQEMSFQIDRGEARALARWLLSNTAPAAPRGGPHA